MKREMPRLRPITERRRRRMIEVLEQRQPDLTVVIENVHDPHNISAVLRSCDAVGIATVHLMGTRKPREGIVVRGTEKKYEDTGRLDHIAFAATDPDGVRKRLQAKDVKFRESIVPRTGDTQFFMYDPDGVGVELNFPKS